jgi:hypothetical protein
MIMPQSSRPQPRRGQRPRTLVTSLLLIMLAVMIVRDILVRRWSAERPPLSGVTRRSL